MGTYEKSILEVKAENAGHLIGAIYRHTARGSLYKITGFSVFKQSGGSELDETVVVHYTDSEGNPHTRPKGDFFGWNNDNGELYPRFVLERWRG